jgi:hypothetical protein
VAGLTYSLPNRDLQYQNGIDFHIDWAASKFLTETVQVGVVSNSPTTADPVRPWAASAA